MKRKFKQSWSTFHQFQHKTYNLITPQTTEYKKRDNLSRKLKWKAIQTYLDKFSYLCYYSSNGIPLNTNLSPTPTQVLSNPSYIYKMFEHYQSASLTWFVKSLQKKYKQKTTVLANRCHRCKTYDNIFNWNKQETNLRIYCLEGSIYNEDLVTCYKLGH
jgi:hypothetical protein